MTKPHEFQYVTRDDGNGYWTLKDTWFLPYPSITPEETKNVPVPFYLYGLKPDSPLGWPTEDPDEFTNILELPSSFDELKITGDHRKDLKRIEKKNELTMTEFDRKEDFDKAAKWFLELWPDEDASLFSRRKDVWLKNCRFISARLDGELIAFHISWPEGHTAHYCGCWWDRKHKNMSPAVFLLKKDIERAISEGRKTYDLGIGDEKYKKDWSPRSAPTKYYAKMSAEDAAKLDIKYFEKI